jgi:hypothetical protein
MPVWRNDRNPALGLGKHGSAVGTDVHVYEGTAAVSVTCSRVTADAARFVGAALGYTTQGSLLHPHERRLNQVCQAFGERRGSCSDVLSVVLASGWKTSIYGTHARGGQPSGLAVPKVCRGARRGMRRGGGGVSPSPGRAWQRACAAVIDDCKICRWARMYATPH